MVRRHLPIHAAMIAALCGGLASPASAYKWPGTGPSIGGAVSARVIGQKCPDILSTSEIGELDAFLAKAAAEEKAKTPSGKKLAMPIEESVKSLTESYASKYNDPKACDGDAREEARDMLGRVKTFMTSGRPIFPDPNDPNRRPEVGEAIIAKVTGEKCPGTLTGLELAELQLVIAKFFVQFGRSATNEDTLVMMQNYQSIERDLANGFGGWFDSRKGCTDEAMRRAKEVAARAHKAETASLQ